MMVILINDLLDLAKLETMNFTFNDEYFNLGQLIENAKDTIMYQATQRNIQISVDYKIEISKTDSKYFGIELTQTQRRQIFDSIMGDKLRYMQILLNFLTNAVKFTKEGDNIEIRVKLLELQDLEEVCDVSDKIDKSD